MLILDHDKVRIAYGAEWIAIRTIGDTKPEARRLARAHKATVFTVVKPRLANSQEVAGVGKAKLKPKEPTYTAAEVLSVGVGHGAKEGAYLALVGDGKYAFVAILEGGPSPGFDVVGSPQEVLAAASEYGQYFAAGAPLYVHSAVTHDTPADVMQLLRDHQSVVAVVDALPGIDSDLALLNPLAPMGTDRGMLVAGGAALAMLLLGGGWYGYSWYEEQSATELRKQRETQNALHIYRSSVDSAFNSLAIDQSADAGVAVWNMVEKLRIQRAGWTLDKVECTAGNCTLGYHQEPKEGTFDSFVKTLHAPEAPEVKVSTLSTSRVGVAVPSWDKVPKLALDQLADVQAQLDVAFGTQGQIMQFAGLVVSIGDLAPLGDDAALRQAGVPAGTVPRYSYGSWQIKGPADTFTAAMSRLPAQSTLSAVSFTISGEDVTYDAQGRYFTKR